jgi:hypothetical protein
VAGKGVEHVGHKTDGVIELGDSRPVNIQPDNNISFFGLSGDFGNPHRVPEKSRSLRDCGNAIIPLYRPW